MEFVLDIHHQEKDFIAACVNQERWAQKKLYEDHYPIMLPVCLRYAHNENEALDILHEAFIKVLKNMSKYQSGTSLKAWIKRIVVNTSIDYYRKNTRRRTEDIDTAYGVSQDSPDAVSSMTAQEIMAVLQQLSPAYRTVFNLYVVEGYSHKEVADAMGITESTSRSNLVKARSKMRELLISKNIENGY